MAVQVLQKLPIGRGCRAVFGLGWKDPHHTWSAALLFHEGSCQLSPMAQLEHDVNVGKKRQDTIAAGPADVLGAAVQNKLAGKLQGPAADALFSADGIGHDPHQRGQALFGEGRNEIVGQGAGTARKAAGKGVNFTQGESESVEPGRIGGHESWFAGVEPRMEVPFFSTDLPSSEEKERACV